MGKKPTGKTSKKMRPARIVFVIVIVIAALSVMWPGYTLFSSATPLIFGFPLSFAWMILWVMISFIAMLGLYFSDKRAEESD